MRKLLSVLVLFFMCSLTAFAQKTVSGKVTSAEDGSALPGVTVQIKGTNQGTQTDFDGNYTLKVSDDAKTLIFSFVGLKTQEVEINGQSTVNMGLSSDEKLLSEVVVTALGISREERSIGYAMQQVKGDDLTKIRTSNVVTSLSGRVAGVQIRTSGNMGGSANILVRGSRSMTGNNQPLFVVDGVPLDNSSNSSNDQRTGRGGYDYGNAASDINPDDIETISVLKSASATALYGSRAANGVILITTKKGMTRKGIGVSVNSGVTFSQINTATLPKHQKEYGAGYGAYYDDPTGYFFYEDVDGDGNPDLSVPSAEDASWGAKFDPNLQVYHWYNLDPQIPEYYLKKSPWVAGANGIDKFFETGVQYTNNVSINGGNDKTTFRLSYTNLDEKGVLPNSSLKRNTLSFNGSHKLNDKLTAAISVNYVRTAAVGRTGTGYDALNPMQSFGQWFQTNLDMDILKRYYESPNGDQLTWNRKGPFDRKPAYFDNPYWTRNKNYNNDTRDRMYGNFGLTYQATDWLSVTGRLSRDGYSEVREQRIAVGSIDPSQYQKTLGSYSETNYDLMVNFKKNIGEDLSISGVAGVNRRDIVNERTTIQTNTGLVVPNLYSLSNTINAISSNDVGETYQTIQVNGVYASASFGYKGMLFVDLTGRNDWSSTLPTGNNSYFYPSVSTSFVFSELLKDQNILSFGKFRMNYAKVGNDAAPLSVYTTYTQNPTFGAATLASVASTLNNSKLKPEQTISYEAGLEMRFLQDRLGIDFSVYQTNTVDQIMPVELSKATGYSFAYTNAGEMQNRGIELMINGTVFKKAGFSWDITLNWAKNMNKVVSLFGESQNLQLTSLQGGVSLNASIGQPFPSIQGTDFVYKDGQKQVTNAGYYSISPLNTGTLGSAVPDWTGGITNTFSYKGISLTALVDMQQGGSIFSLNTLYGRATGVYAETAGNNELGVPMRNPVVKGSTTSGGLLLKGVKADGSANDVRVPVQYGGAFHWTRNPAAQYVFDATYIKFRELSINYTLPTALLNKTPFRNAVISVVGRNLAIFKKNTEHFDPETTLGAGNLQGYESGSMPTPITWGFNLRLDL